ncbi:MAG: ABC transporter ATP-binding protein [Proteobacteria bacterium]|nr:ABC transporter ATP-binding protein [Pseudomonadota bacterium]
MNFTSLIRQVTPRFRVLLVIVLLLVLGNGVSLLNPVMAGQLTSLLLDSGEAKFPDISSLLMVWLLLLALRTGFSFGADTFISITGESTMTALRTRVYEHMQSLPMGYFHERKPGDLLALMDNDATTVGWYFIETLSRIVPALITFVGALVMMCLIDPWITALVAVLMPLYYLLIKIAGRRIRPLSARWFQAYADMVVVLEENIGLMQVIKSFRRESVESARFDERNQALYRLSGRSVMAENLLPSLAGFAASAGLLLLIGFASGELDTGAMTVAELVMLMFYAFMLAQPLASFADLYGRYQYTRGASDRLLAFFSTMPEPVSVGQPDIGRLAGRITFDQVEFAYPGRGPVLKGISFDIQPGETVAISGSNGCGKSTLAYLLMRFSDPDSGRVLLDGKDIREFSLSSVRREIGLVSQNMLLHNGTIAENIAYANASASMDEIEQAAAAALATDFIRALPDGFQTVIGDQGIRLSGGQRQRLSLARTLLKDSQILVLDEATSMFDPEGELAFLERNRALFASKTVILITHRTAALKFADRQLRVNEGRLV